MECNLNTISVQASVETDLRTSKTVESHTSCTKDKPVTLQNQKNDLLLEI